jgi:hypothetical protein
MKGCGRFLPNDRRLGRYDPGAYAPRLALARQLGSLALWRRGRRVGGIQDVGNALQNLRPTGQSGLWSALFGRQIDLEHVAADLDLISVVQGSSINPEAIDEYAVRAVQVEDFPNAAGMNEAAMAPADVGHVQPQVAAGLAANQRYGRVQLDRMTSRSKNQAQRSNG